MENTDLELSPVEPVRKRKDVSEIVAWVALLFFFVHGFAYVVLLNFFPELIKGTALAQDIYIPGFRFLDPGIWFFWFFGWLFILQSVFLTTRYIFLVTVSVVLYALSFMPTLVWGFMYGLGVVVGAGLLALTAIWFGKNEEVVKK